MPKLNDVQMQAVNHIEGPLMVLAGPGSGKTTVITHRALNLIAAVPSSNVLVITFSKAAALEMEQRFKTLSDKSVTFGTFHAVFFRILRHRYNFSVEQLLKETERHDIVSRLLKKMGIITDDDLLSEVRNEISLVKNELHDLEQYSSAAIDAEEFRQLYSEYEATKEENRKIDFDDMLLLCHGLWQKEPDCLHYWQQKYPYIMIDEFQDINRVQYECIRMLSAPPHHLCIVGDDDQSIYRFRGARPEFLLNFPNDFPKVKQITLDTNYRSTDAIISFSNRLIANNKVRYDKAIVGTQRAGPNPKITIYNDQSHEAISIANQLRKIEKLSEVAVIYRVNIQSRAFTDAFRQANIPFTVKDEISSIYEHWMARDIFAYLRLGLDIEREGELHSIINKPFRYISKAFLQKAQKENRKIFDWYDKSGMLNTSQQQSIEELQWNLGRMSKLSADEAIRFIRKNIDYNGYINNYCNYRNVGSTGLYEIMAELQEAAATHGSISDFLAYAEESVANKDDDTSGERVTLITMHSAKGLEFDTVYIVGAIEGLLPHERSRTPIAIEEERRLLYVGATRARRNLFISAIKKRHEKKVEPSRFLKEFQKKSRLWG
ncbi:MAG: ATP-dependent helicase [Turicibacter sp.]|nr:ATP-dependent helicase [Turicibacter sp.]